MALTHPHTQSGWSRRGKVCYDASSAALRRQTGTWLRVECESMMAETTWPPQPPPPCYSSYFNFKRKLNRFSWLISSLALIGSLH